MILSEAQENDNEAETLEECREIKMDQ